MRYAANDPVAAARERFLARRITSSAAGLYLVRLREPPSALHLTHQQNLDALGLDDRVSTGRFDRASGDSGGDDPLLAVGQHLSDAVFDWWAGTPPPIVYRTRTAPSARSMAFTESCPWDSHEVRLLREATSLLTVLVTHHGFDVPGHWL